MMRALEFGHLVTCTLSQSPLVAGFPEGPLGQPFTAGKKKRKTRQARFNGLTACQALANFTAAKSRLLGKAVETASSPSGGHATPA